MHITLFTSSSQFAFRKQKITQKILEFFFLRSSLKQFFHVFSPQKNVQFDVNFQPSTLQNPLQCPVSRYIFSTSSRSRILILWWGKLNCIDNQQRQQPR